MGRSVTLAAAGAGRRPGAGIWAGTAPRTAHLRGRQWGSHRASQELLGPWVGTAFS